MCLCARPPPADLAGKLFLVGTVLFSGSLYVLVLTDVRKLGSVPHITSQH